MSAWVVNGDPRVDHRRALEIVAGIFIVFAGLVFAGAQIPLTLLREKKLPLPRGKGPLTPVLAGERERDGDRATGAAADGTRSLDESAVGVVDEGMTFLPYRGDTSAL